MNWILHRDSDILKKKIAQWSKVAEDELGDLSGYSNVYKVFNDQGVFRLFEEDGQRAIFAFLISPDFRGGKSLCELFMYVKPEARGSMCLFKSMIRTVEKYAKEQGCTAIEIGSNCGYRDEKTIEILTRFFGYNHYSVRKEI